MAHELVRCLIIQAGHANLHIEYWQSPEPDPYGMTDVNGFGSGRLAVAEARATFNRILRRWYLRELEVEPPADYLIKTVRPA
jgi:hypothetical protein